MNKKIGIFLLTILCCFQLHIIESQETLNPDAETLSRLAKGDYIFLNETDIDDYNDDGFNYTEIIDTYAVVCNDETGDEPKIECTCKNQTLECGGYRNELNRTDLKIANKDFIVKKVEFEHNSITYLEKDMILPGNGHTIEEISFYSSRIEIIENGTFDNFVALKKLRLGGNYIKILHEGILTKQLGKTLKELDLSWNHELEWVIFENLPNLEELIFNGNDLSVLTNISQPSKSLENLRFLLCSEYCNLSNINEDFFKNFKSLEKLHIGGIWVKSIPKSLNLLPNLIDLKITESWFYSIGDCAFCGLIKLRKLDLSHNRLLRVIHENAFGYVKNRTLSPTSLKYFSIEKCRTKTIPENLLNWKNVTSMKISGDNYDCDCSMAWLINDLQSPKSSYASKIDDHPESLTIRQLRCSNYPYAHIPFIFLNKSYCKTKNETSEKTLHAQPPQESFFQRHWLLLFIVCVLICGGVAAAGVHFYRNRAFASPFQRRRQSPEEEEKLEEDFDSTNV